MIKRFLKKYFGIRDVVYIILLIVMSMVLLVFYLVVGHKTETISKLEYKIELRDEILKMNTLKEVLNSSLNKEYMEIANHNLEMLILSSKGNKNKRMGVGGK